MTTALLALLVAATPAAGRTYSVEPSKSLVRYHIVHKLHRVTGHSSTIEGKGVLQPDGTVLAMVRVPMASFDSGERNRDADMREAVDARRFPFVVFKGTTRLDGGALAAAQGTTVEAKMDGEIDLHGVKKRIVVPLTIDLAPDGSARARGSFEVSLDAFGIERPSLLFVKIEDRCRIELDLLLRGERP
jgi:polyisoprenoid-binding protein YceI